MAKLATPLRACVCVDRPFSIPILSSRVGWMLLDIARCALSRLMRASEGRVATSSISAFWECLRCRQWICVHLSCEVGDFIGELCDSLAHVD